jgi:hypothetical protein
LLDAQLFKKFPAVVQVSLRQLVMRPQEIMCEIVILYLHPGTFSPSSPGPASPVSGSLPGRSLFCLAVHQLHIFLVSYLPFCYLHYAYKFFTSYAVSRRSLPLEACRLSHTPATLTDQVTQRCWSKYRRYLSDHR